MEWVKEVGAVTMLLLDGRWNSGGGEIWEENIQELFDLFGGDLEERGAGVIPPYTNV